MTADATPTPPDPPRATGPAGPPAGPTADPSGARLIAFATAAGLLAGLGSWAVGEATLNTFRPPLQRQIVFGQVMEKANYEDQARADFRNAVVAFAALGAALGGSLGLAGGWARGATPGAIRAGAAGLPLGGLLATAASFALLPFYFRAEDRSVEELSRDLVLPLLVFSGIWSAAGLGGGLALGLGLGGGRDRVIRAALGGLLGAALGAALYEIVGAAAIPAGKTHLPLPPSPSVRLLARLLAATSAGLLAGTFASLQTTRRHAKTEAS